MSRIVVGIDDSESSRAALAWAADEARRHGAQIVVVHAWTVPASAYGTSLLPYVPPLQDVAPYRAAAQAVVDRALASVDLEDLDVDVQLVTGHAGDALVVAGRDASMVVIGTRSRGAIADLVLGSTARHVSKHAEVPVVVIPPGAVALDRRAAA